MKKTFISLSVAALFAVGSLPAIAGDGCCPGTTKGPAKPAKAKVVSAVCPVMKSKIPDIKKASGKSIYKGKTYYFCCGGCKPQFDKDPAKYIKKK